MIAIVAAMEREVRGLVKATGCSRPDGPSSQGLSSQSYMLQVTGMGRGGVEEGMRALRARIPSSTPPGALLSLGYAGGLAPALLSGDLVVSRRIHTTGPEAPLDPDPDLASAAVEAARTLAAPARCFLAESVTVPREVRTPDQKALLAESTGASIATMEDYWIADAAARWCVPFVSVRAVLDPAGEALPASVAGVPDSGLPGQLAAVLRGLLRHPWELPGVMKLAKQERVARSILTAFGVSFLAGMESVSDAMVGDAPAVPTGAGRRAGTSE